MTNIIKKQFEKSYSTYDENAIVQKIMADRLVEEILNLSAKFNNVLEIGSGTGILTSRLVQNIIFQNYFANDLVENSYNCIKKYSQIKFYSGDILNLKTKFDPLDLIVSNAVFQWFNDLDFAIEYISRWLSIEGILAFSTFSPDNFKEFKAVTGISLKYPPVDDIKLILNKYFYNVQIYTFEKTLHFNSSLELLKHLKKTGVNSVLKRPWSLKEIRNFCKHDLLDLTYSPVIVIATDKKL